MTTRIKFVCQEEGIQLNSEVCFREKLVICGLPGILPSSESVFDMFGVCLQIAARLLQITLSCKMSSQGLWNLLILTKPAAYFVAGVGIINSQQSLWRGSSTSNYLLAGLHHCNLRLWLIAPCFRIHQTANSLLSASALHGQTEPCTLTSPHSIKLL